jgi:hypothetical protein
MMFELRVFLPGSLLVRELDLRGSKMGGFEVAKLFALRLWPVWPLVIAVLKLRALLLIAAYSFNVVRPTAHEEAFILAVLTRAGVHVMVIHGTDQH